MGSSQSCGEGKNKDNFACPALISNLCYFVYKRHDFLTIKEERFASWQPWFGAESQHNGAGGIMHYLCGDEPPGFLSFN